MVLALLIEDWLTDLISWRELVLGPSDSRIFAFYDRWFGCLPGGLKLLSGIGGLAIRAPIRPAFNAGAFKDSDRNNGD